MIFSLFDESLEILSYLALPSRETVALAGAGGREGA
jgi:hypothetical protein